jgi:exosortase/archaeosortase
MSTTMMFWGYAAGFALIALFVGRLVAKNASLARRIDALQR